MSWRETPTYENQRENELNETELRDLIRRADKFPDRKGSLRRAAFQRLLSLAQSPNPQFKKLVTEKVKDFFVDFPDLQEEAINAVYDLCEDQDQSVRILGYGAIASVSRVAKHWLLRNADVLVQLLQSDDEREVAVVKRALQEHVDLDPSHILQMLCEQCSFDADRLDDDEERALRSRLRTLVIDFLSEKYRGCVARAVKTPEVEKILVRGLVPAIPRATVAERQKLVYDILIHLPSFSPQSSTEVFDIILDISRSVLQSDLTTAHQKSRSDLKNALPLLHFASILSTRTNTTFPATTRGASSSTHRKETRLFEFYLSLTSSGGLFSGKTLESIVTPSSCIRFIDFYMQAYEKADHSKLLIRTNESPDKLTQSLLELLSVLSAVITSTNTASHLMSLALRPSHSILRAIHKRLLGTKGSLQVPTCLHSDVRKMQEVLSSASLLSKEIEDKEYADLIPTAEEVAALQKEISETIRSLIEALARPTSGENELRIRGQGSLIGSGAMKRRFDIEQGSRTSLAVNVEQGLSVRGAARLAQGSDAMDVDDTMPSNAPPSAPGRSEPSYEKETLQAHKRRKGRNGGTDETQHAAASGASAIKPQQQMELPSLLSRLQGTSSPLNTASPRIWTPKQTSGSPMTDLAARFSPNNTDVSSSAPPIHTLGSANSLAARLEMPSFVSTNWSVLSTDISLPKGNASNSHDYSSRRHSERSNVPASAGQPRRRVVRRAMSTLGTTSLATDTSGSLDDEIKIRGAAQRVAGDQSDGLDRRQGVSLLARLGDGGGGNAGKGGVGAGGHRIRK